MHFCGDPNDRLLPQSLGAGCVIADFDQDNDNDIYFLQGNDLTAPRATPSFNALYWNNGDGTFTLAGPKCGVDHNGFGISGSVADVDQDGDLDLYLCNLGPNALLLNNGDGTFQAVENAVLKMRGSVPVQRSLMQTRMATWISTSPDTWIGPSILKQNVSTLGWIRFLPACHNRLLGDKFFQRKRETFVEETRILDSPGHYYTVLARPETSMAMDGTTSTLPTTTKLPVDQQPRRDIQWNGSPLDATSNTGKVRRHVGHHDRY